MLFIDNKYTKIYYNIIDRARSRALSTDTYTESHHIIPKSLGGVDLKANRAILTAREHFICHWLLTKMTSGPANRKMTHALVAMGRQSNNQHRYINNRAYELAKIQNGIELSKLFTGRVSPTKGKSHTPESKAKIGAAGTGRKHSQESIQKMRDIKLGKKRAPFSEETKKNMSNSAKLRAPMSEESRLKRSLSQLGKPKSEETKSNIKKSWGTRPRVSRIIDRKEMPLAHFNRWQNSLSGD
jgi:hypothetical protein